MTAPLDPTDPLAVDAAFLAELDAEAEAVAISVPTPTREIRPLTDDEIVGAMRAEIHAAESSETNIEVQFQREKALRYHRGAPFGNEVDGRSQVILTDVSDTIEWMMPALMQLYMGSDRIVRFKARKAQHGDFAEQATAVMNDLFFNRMAGFRFSYDWMKAALLEKNCEAKAWFEETWEPEIRELEGIDEIQLTALAQDDDWEVLELQELEERLRQQGPQGEPIELRLFNATLRRLKPLRQLRVEAIPSEQFLIASRATRLDDRTPFVDHRVRTTISDLIALGYPRELVVDLPSDDSVEFAPERQARDGMGTTFLDDVSRPDAASRTVWVHECYARIDADGDGYAELRKIVLGGSEGSSRLLENKAARHVPFADLCPIPMPHRFYGWGIPDLVMDLMEIRSTLLRQLLDNIYLQNNSRVAVVEGAVEIDDLLTATVGGVVRQSAPGMIEPIVTPQLGAWAFQALEYLDGVRENRTGITRYNQGLDAQSLNKTATGISAIMGAANAKIELIGKLFLDGWRRLFRLLLRELVESPMKDYVVQLRGQWVSVDPSQWDPEMDVEIEVGFGPGQAMQRVQYLTQILQLQAEAIARGYGGYIVQPENVYAAARRLEEAMGFTQAGLFFTDPKGQEPPKPNPTAPELQLQGKLEEVKAEASTKQAEIQLQGRRGELELRFKAVELEQKMKLEREKLKIDETIRLRELEIEEQRLELEKEKIEVQRVAAQAKVSQTAASGASAP